MAFFNSKPIANLIRFVFIIGLITLLAFLPACTSDEESSSNGQDEEIVKLVYQDWRTDWFPAMTKEML